MVPPCSSIGVAGPVIAALAEHSGAEGGSESRQTEDDLGVRVLLKSTP